MRLVRNGTLIILRTQSAADEMTARTQKEVHVVQDCERKQTSGTLTGCYQALVKLAGRILAEPVKRSRKETNEQNRPFLGRMKQNFGGMKLSFVKVRSTSLPTGPQGYNSATYGTMVSITIVQACNMSTKA